MSETELVNKIVMFRTELERQNAGLGIMGVFDTMCAYFGEQHRDIGYKDMIIRSRDEQLERTQGVLVDAQEKVLKQAKEIERASGLLRKLNAYIDFEEHLDNGDWGIEDTSSINELFDEVSNHISIQSLSEGSDTPSKD